MKKILLCLTALFLSSCIPVGDFGPYWDKGIIDPALLGKWNGEDKEGYGIVDKGGTYQIDTLDEREKKEKSYVPMTARTLKAGSYTFLMIKESNKKEVIRYKIEGDVIQKYSLAPEQLSAFLLKEKYPEAKNIVFGEVHIENFDDEVYKILSEIPDTKKFWVPDGKYRRQTAFNN
ncbi:MAG: hypothetical protein V1721_03680 [Pseudomonadota bacterium]